MPLLTNLRNRIVGYSFVSRSGLLNGTLLEVGPTSCPRPPTGALPRAPTGGLPSPEPPDWPLFILGLSGGTPPQKKSEIPPTKKIDKTEEPKARIHALFSRTKSCNYHIRELRCIHPYLDFKTANTILNLTTVTLSIITFQTVNLTGSNRFKNLLLMLLLRLLNPHISLPF